jgi:hypothetical protein
MTPPSRAPFAQAVAERRTYSLSFADRLAADDALVAPATVTPDAGLTAAVIATGTDSVTVRLGPTTGPGTFSALVAAHTQNGDLLEHRIVLEVVP